MISGIQEPKNVWEKKMIDTIKKQVSYVFHLNHANEEADFREFREFLLKHSELTSHAESTICFPGMDATVKIAYYTHKMADSTVLDKMCGYVTKLSAEEATVPEV